MKRPAAVLTGCLLFGAANAGDSAVYFDCIAADGSPYQAAEPCRRGERQQQRQAAEYPPLDLGRPSNGLVRLNSGRGGHFFATCQVNGVALRFIVDTGATTVALSASAARRLKLDSQRGQRYSVQTANGSATVTGVTLDRIELQGQSISKVAAHILDKELGNEDGLLGMSFLRHFEINSDAVTMTLRRK